MEHFTDTDRIYISRCLQLARNGRGSTSPNPMVGAVIVCDGRIIGEGYHIRAGEAHAEVNAVRSVSENDLSLLSQSTMYVSLEPCSHYGKTPPCCELIISCKIPRVVVATTDYNSLVNGGGIARMRNAGIDVRVGLLSEEAVALNRYFFTFHKLSRPFITLKWAQTADGFIDTYRDSGVPLQISTAGSQVAVHKLRSEHDAILVGTRTALLDDPSLTVRHWSGRVPLRLVVDRNNILPSTLKLFDGTLPTVLYTYNVLPDKFGENVEQVRLNPSTNLLSGIVEHLVSLKLNSLLVEGGATLLQSFIDMNLWDVARVEYNPELFIGCGVQAPVLCNVVESESFTCFGNKISLYMR
ncbi:MAG: bifunctional diaminohydroxyphosphoribosylaminopyrimidine deaminase/5-amino-6-(5-phosphoribosylamino)uracil reductase RibD [Bacteroidaceae bacterium]|nr:bifunctional diaminohydroxyphosphoribosylaminopyrimidine deaminase/5-amino-6-(5-phosphoribosylamino)uracil reductase RibD [Bacteroidaceae bacterium]